MTRNPRLTLRSAISSLFWFLACALVIAAMVFCGLLEWTEQ